MGRGVVTTRQLLKYGGRYCGGDSNSASACIGVTFFLFPRSFGAQNGRIFFARILDLLMNRGNQRPKIEPALYVTSGLAAASSPRSPGKVTRQTHDALHLARSSASRSRSRVPFIGSVSAVDATRLAQFSPGRFGGRFGVTPPPSTSFCFGAYLGGDPAQGRLLTEPSY